MKGHDLITLEYGYGALEPYIDEETVKIHHTKHHKAYVDKLNNAIGSVDYDGPADIVELLKNLDNVPESIRQVVRDNAGGTYNHNLYWSVMRSGGSVVDGVLANAIDNEFGSFDKFKDLFIKTAISHVGSGWTWLYVENGSLKIANTINHDNPFMRGYCKISGTPLLVMDIWEHAYYLKYQNRKLEYMENFFKLIAWDVVSKYYVKCI